MEIECMYCKADGLTKKMISGKCSCGAHYCQNTKLFWRDELHAPIQYDHNTNLFWKDELQKNESHRAILDHTSRFLIFQPKKSFYFQQLLFPIRS